METEYIVLYQFVNKPIGTREVIKDIQTFVIYGKTKNTKYHTHS